MALRACRGIARRAYAVADLTEVSPCCQYSQPSFKLLGPCPSDQIDTIALPRPQTAPWAAVGQTRPFRSTPLAQKDIEVEIQTMGESITEGTIVEILKKEGDAVEEDETIAQIETDKVTVDVRAPASGQLTKLRMSVEDTVKVGQVVAVVSEGSEGTKDRSGSTEPSEEQSHEKHEDPEESDRKIAGRREATKQPSGRKPSISFPQRMQDGKRLSEMAESERPSQSKSASKTEEKRPSEAKTPPKKSQPWYVGKEQGTKLSQSRVLTQKEMDQIELGGAEP